MAQALTLQPSSCNMTDTSLANTARRKRTDTSLANKTRKRHSQKSNKHCNKHLALLVANMLKKAIQANRVDTDHNPKAQLTMRQCKLWALALFDVFTNPRVVRARMLRAPNDSIELTCSPTEELLTAPSADCSADCAPPGSQLTQDLMGLHQLLHLRASEHEQEHVHMTDLIKSHAVSVAAAVWGGEVAVKIYGSRAVGMALPDSDIDVALLPSVQLSPLQQTEALTMLAGQLLESGGWSSGRVISGHTVTLTAVPVLKLVMEHGYAAAGTLPMRVMLDVTLANNNNNSTTDKASSIDGSADSSKHVGLHGIEIVRRLKASHEALAPVVMFLKQLLVTSNLNDPYSGGLGSYALTLMVASVMQREEAKGECFEAGELLCETLDYYANSFNPLKDCVRPLPHSGSTPNGSLTIEPGSSTTPLQVFDPEHADMNVAASSFRFNLVQHLFGWVHRELSKHYLDTTDVSPQLGVLLEIVTRKHDALY